ncbi:monocarboxylate transporter 3 [Latimeria chalumnae]|uniref:monocarboxylate transporter 3 n=1 Tax=Latimeria chalumnae TaxID=7897 RepID=UPI0003C16667|nr:PREDICTED: monocarboxylate transporter 3 [Latimeria chalumnae]|eukprot:XP_006002033.1 PREDICTED: monocarboxylate transporter 3 [Latimeria chalumnae]
MGFGEREGGLVPLKPPDGGWGWVVLLGCFVITGFSYAFPKAVSVYFKELMYDFHIGYSDTAWISSIMLAMLYGTGPVSSILVNQFGCRPVMLVGGLLASAGMVLASFSTNIIELYLTAGVVTGLGLALNFQPSLIMLGRYFDKRRPLANGLAAAGSPVFLSALSPLGQFLLETFGWRGGFLIMGGLLLNCCTCGAVMRPLERPGREWSRDRHEVREMLPMGRSEDSRGTKKKSKKAAAAKKHQKLLDFSVFSNRGFVIYTIAKFILVLGLFVPPIMIVNYAKDMGIPDTEAAFLLSIIGFIDIVARPSCGVIAGLKWMRPRVTFFFSVAVLFNGLTDICSATSASYKDLVIFCVFFGVSYGMVGALQFEVLMAIVGSQKFSSAIGLVLLIEAVAVLIGPPSAGRLVDTFKNYELIFYMAGSEVLFSSLFLALGSYFCLKRGTPKTGGHEDTKVDGEPDPEEEISENHLLKADGSAGANRARSPAGHTDEERVRHSEGEVELKPDRALERDCF